MINQYTPYGSLNYSSDPNAPGGYSATQTLSPAQQQILSLMQQGQTGAGTAAAGLGGQLAGMYGQPANLDTQSLTNQMMNWQNQSIQPYWDIQKSNLEAQLQNQGLNPNDAAWQNAMMSFTKGIGQAQNQFFTQAEPLAFSQALTQYQLPLQNFASLMGMSQPQNPNYVNAPQGQVAPPDYQGLAEQQYAQQNQQYGNMMQGLFGIPTALAGGWAKSVFPGKG